MKLHTDEVPNWVRIRVLDAIAGIDAAKEAATEDPECPLITVMLEAALIEGRNARTVLEEFTG